MQLESRKKDYLLVSDFDQTLSFNDSDRAERNDGHPDFEERIRGLADIATWSSRAANWLTCCCTTRSIAAYARSI